jgi:hypothetical protein
MGKEVKKCQSMYATGARSYAGLRENAMTSSHPKGAFTTSAGMIGKHYGKRWNEK